jgi:putative transposase
MGGVCNNWECQPIKIGDYTDHVHILCMLSKKIALMKLLEEVKSHSSKWMKTKDESLKNFYWQDGYGAFSVNPSQVETVIAYNANQHAHHSKKIFKDEYRVFLKKYKVEYDERYVWDKIFLLYTKFIISYAQVISPGSNDAIKLSPTLSPAASMRFISAISKFKPPGPPPKGFSGLNENNFRGTLSS